MKAKNLFSYLPVLSIAALFVGVILLSNITSGISGNKELLAESIRSQAETTIKNVSPKEAKELIDSGNEVFLLDVRTKEEYNESHIKTAHLVPVQELEQHIDLSPKETNEKRLVEISVVGEVASPRSSWHPFRITPEGKPVVLPGLGGITYNVKVGDNAVQWEADHVEPCVTVRNKDVDENGALNLLACIGNTAKIITGDAKGETGIVTGKHGGIENVLVDFDDG